MNFRDNSVKTRRVQSNWHLTKIESVYTIYFGDVFMNAFYGFYSSMSHRHTHVQYYDKLNQK